MCNVSRTPRTAPAACQTKFKLAKQIATAISNRTRAEWGGCDNCDGLYVFTVLDCPGNVYAVAALYQDKFKVYYLYIIYFGL